ncbi:MAG: hypothetical protein KKA60_16125 [Proteobacteria bacterium]|nr:hypothetical protein [Pseudomonadota bacterium]
MEDLWPGMTREDQLRAPVSILREQAAFLAGKTGRLVEALVKREERAGKAELMGEAGTPGYFRFSFFLVAPRLEDYRYRLFHIHHDFNLYPVIIYPDEGVKTEIRPGGEEGILAENEEEFRAALRSIFSAKKTARIIRALMAQSPGE